MSPQEMAEPVFHRLVERCLALTLLYVICAPGLLLAAEPAAPAVSLRGFGTLGATRSDAKGADFVHGFFEPNGAGTTREWALGVDSKAGLQLDARFGEQLTAVVQVVSQHRYDNTYTPQLEWANLKYQVTPDFDVRVGRTVTAPFMVSESRLVGYSNIWVRPPQELYGLVPVTNKDGIDSTYRFQIAGVSNSIHVSYGQTSLKLPAAASVKAEDYLELADTVESGPFTLRASYSTGRVSLHTTELDTLVGGYTDLGNALTAFGFTAAGAQAREVVSRYRFEKAPISVLAFGAMYDREAWLLMAEWARFNGHSILADSKAWYATVGYRMSKFTPYVTAARLTAGKRTEPGVTTAGLPPPLAASAAALNSGINAYVNGTRFAQSSVSAGMRWDFFRNAALKIQYDRVRPESGSSGRLGAIQPAFTSGGRVNVISVTVDFVF